MNNNAKIQINGVDYSSHLPRPVSVKYTYTDELPTATLELVGLTLAHPFEPMSEVLLNINGEQTMWCMASDDIDCTYGRKVYKHTINLVDATKKLERILCGAKAFTKPLYRSYIGSTSAVMYQATKNLSGTFSLDSINYFSSIEGKTDYVDIFDNDDEVTANSIVLYLHGNKTGGGSSETTTTITTTVYYNHTQMFTYQNISEFEVAYQWVSQSTSVPAIDNFTANKGNGVYTIVQHCNIHVNNVQVQDINYYYLYPVTIVSPSTDDAEYTYREILEILLETAKPKRIGTALPLPLEELGGVPFALGNMPENINDTAPEFSFSDGRTLSENLQEVANALGCKMRLVWRNGTYYVDFLPLGLPGKADFSNGTEVDFQESENLQDFATTIESNAQNLINDEKSGYITEPDYVGFLSMRSDDVRIKEDTGYISTSFPVWKIVRLLATFGDQTKDITKYCYEADSYDVLSSFTGVYPLSKTYALKYTKGLPNITDLWYKVQDRAVAIFNAFNNPAIVNVLQHAGLSGINSNNIMDVSFRVEYIPIINARIRQVKVGAPTMNESELAFNQSASRISALNYGEKMRGQIGMLGTTSIINTYVYKNYLDVAKPGLMANDTDYITDVLVQVFPNYCIATYTFTTDYNGIGAYISLPSEFRQYEIPDSIERNILLEEYCNITSKQETAYDNTIAQPQLKNAIVSSLADATSAADGISNARIDTYDDTATEESGTIQHNRIASVQLPVYTTPFGNSVYMAFRYADNFSAGTKAVPAEFTEGSTIKTYKLTEYVPYGDALYGRAKYLRYRVQPNNKLTTAYTDKDKLPDAQAFGYGANTDTLFWTRGHELVLDKDGAEKINIGYQLHFVSDDGLLISGEFAKLMSFAGATHEDGTLWFYQYDEEVNRFTLEPSANAQILSSSLVLKGANGDKLTSSPTASASQKSWVLYWVVRSGSDIIKQKALVAKNTSEKPPSILYFNIKRRINT